MGCRLEASRYPATREPPKGMMVRDESLVSLIERLAVVCPRYFALENQIETLTRERNAALESVAQQERSLADLTATNTDLTAIIASRDATIASQNAIIVSLKDTIAARDATIADLQQQLNRLGKMIIEMAQGYGRCLYADANNPEIHSPLIRTISNWTVISHVSLPSEESSESESSGTSSDYDTTIVGGLVADAAGAADAMDYS